MYIIIRTTPDSWDDSTIIAVGVQFNNRSLPAARTSIKAADLPEPYLSVWHVAVEQFRAMGGGEWDAASVNVYKQPTEDGFKLHCDIHVCYPDLTTSRIFLDLDAPEMIAFYDHYMDEASWPNPTRQEAPTQ